MSNLNNEKCLLAFSYKKSKIIRFWSYILLPINIIITFFHSLDRLKDAASSACCHVFCNLCIASLFGHKQKKQKCPICNGAITRRSFYKRPHIQKISDKFVEILAAMEKDGIKSKAF